MAKILVVDDDAGIRQFLTDILADEGYHVVSVANGRIALSHLSAGEKLPELILLDLMMPVMSGQEFLEVLEQDPTLSQLPIVVFSASPALPETVSYPAVAAYLPKPVELTTLLATVERHCR
jgi:CheY-like chemotaxis protein